MKNKKVVSAEIPNKTILGEFEGECADSNITNLNGLDITREVWEHTFSSDEYKRGIEHGWLIGFLGHPEDPDCQDFEHACIVMTEGHIDDSGKVYGKFNLIDTPVGRIVKSFIDAGVKFGISVRGAGDIVDNSVDPDTFVFRGFDLVAFPAYPESIPNFTEIAASTDIDKRKKYQAVCAAVKNNIEGLNSEASIDIVQSCFAKQSDEYKELENRKKEIAGDEEIDITAEQLDCMTRLCVETSEKLDACEEENKILKGRISVLESAQIRRIKAIERITSSQISDLQDTLQSVNAAYKVLKSSSSRLKDENSKLQNSNLKYKQRVEATSNSIREKDSIISELRSNLDETVNKMKDSQVQASNRDETMKSLRSRVTAAEALVREYQDAYATLYANALGVTLENVKVTASTDVKDLRSMIGQSAGRSSISASTSLEAVDVIDDYDESGLVTL